MDIKRIKEPEANSPVATNPLPILNQNLPPTEMPPCLVRLIEQGIPEGGRNKGLFNLLTFYRKAHADTWEDEAKKIELALELNQQVCNPPLPHNEVYSLVHSVSATRYAYLCSQEPILSLCDRAACEKLEFGVNCKPWKEKFALVEVEELNIRHLRRIDTDPPWYIVEVQGVDISMSNEEFYNARAFMRLVEDRLCLCPRIPKSNEWDKLRQALHDESETIDAPDDASEKGSILNSVMDYLCQYRNSRDADNILRGEPVEQDGYICFKAAGLQRYLRLYRRQFVDDSELYALLHDYGARFKPARIKGRAINVWMFPIEKLGISGEEYLPVNLDVDEEGIGHEGAKEGPIQETPKTLL